MVGHRHADLGLRAGRLRRTDGDDEAVSGDRHGALARRHGAACIAGRAGASASAQCAERAARVCGAACCWSCALGAVQIALGGWVSTNYAVLACSDFPTCQGSWWPTMDFEQGFALQRELGRTSDGAWLPFEALTAIHYVHRLFAYLLIAALLLLAWRLHARAPTSTGSRRCGAWAWSLVGVALWQLASGLSNVILGWPLAAALAHTAGAAMMVMLLTVLIVRMHEGRRSVGGAARDSRGRRARRFLASPARCHVRYLVPLRARCRPAMFRGCASSTR